MARLIINNHSETEVVKEKILKFIPYSQKYEKYYLSINKPNQREELVYLATEKYYIDFNTKKEEKKLINDMSLDEFKKLRTRKVQELVNTFEKEGYYVSTDQLALFINMKIDMLILDNNKN